MSLGLPLITRADTYAARDWLAHYQLAPLGTFAARDDLDILREAAAVIEGETLHMSHPRYARLQALLAEGVKVAA